MAKSWQQKFDNGKDPKVVDLDSTWGGMQAGDKMLISSPAEINEYIKKIPYGKIDTIENMRQQLAKNHNANGTCPLTTGIFTRIVSELAIQKMSNGQKNITPFWRIVDPDSALANKISCEPQFIAQMRSKEKS